MKSEIIDTGSSKIWMDDCGIIHTKYPVKIDVTLESAICDIGVIEKLSKGRKVPLLVNMGNTRSISRDAREYFSGKESVKVMAAAALVVNSAVHRVMGNFFLGINKPPFPLRLFSSEQEALEWLIQFIKK